MANVSINNITETWTSSGTTYSGIKYNVTDTASATGSKLIDLQVGGVSKFSVDKNGYIALNGLSKDASYFTLTSPIYGNINNRYYLDGNLSFGTASCIAWSAGSDPTISKDLFIWRDQANTLAQRNGVNAQSYRIYLSYTDATNNSRFAINATSNYYRLASEIGTSTGSKKPIVTDIYQSTVDPTTTDIPDGTSTVWKNTTSGVVKLWANNGGTLIGVALA